LKQSTKPAKDGRNDRPWRAFFFFQNVNWTKVSNEKGEK